MSSPGEGAILTLEPLIEAAREGVEAAGWSLSGLQKTTSHQFEGRWEGESTRSAYLFFHSQDPLVAEHSSVDVYLDETSRGLTGNIALVVDMVTLGVLGDATAALELLKGLSSTELTVARRRPLTLRLRLDDAAHETGKAEAEVRFKVTIARSVIGKGHMAVRDLVSEAMAGFERLLAAPRLIELFDRD